MAQHALAEEKANPTDLLASSSFPQLCPAARTLGARKGGRSGLLPRGLQLWRARTGQGDVPAQNERPVAGGRFISVLLLFDVHTLVLFTTK